MNSKARIRPLERHDLADLIALCREHADYEKAPWSEHPRREKLEAIFFRSDRAWCWVVDADDELAGFASASLELSTWDAGFYLHLDCLYLRGPYRGRGLGWALVERVARVPLERGAVNVQWQTPVWNRDAARFYRRLGAGVAEKLRFTLDRDACARLLGELPDGGAPGGGVSALEPVAKDG